MYTCLSMSQRSTDFLVETSADLSDVFHEDNSNESQDIFVKHITVPKCNDLLSRVKIECICDHSYIITDLGQKFYESCCPHQQCGAHADWSSRALRFIVTKFPRGTPSAVRLQNERIILRIAFRVDSPLWIQPQILTAQQIHSGEIPMVVLDFFRKVGSKRLFCFAAADYILKNSSKLCFDSVEIAPYLTSHDHITGG